ncbi:MULTISPECIES: methyl-accepting chemotaxis protein [Vibrio]|jgi:methyl-accepting chemotaxis protein|uniref:methyl-accepting chemotaxis protein n=1 Tax=Vibrio TaxID=662 RepID=UPI0001B9445B|nr:MULTISPECIES: methyl-accepting chemotaxis protein [Vibrio]EEX31282.1 methyl-accepting chemotaxis protein [Vibrio coralliilyticus ATCC BAA-450]MCM5507047.1 methyl-accepting chemotaxis protein [Vibrio sp. SCSIO 43169]MDE3896482.1 methyl-accepting chemotaxis protein [Vibrio sp. CC007]NRF62298.1 methyl-accepting chemotaxis protein [Vibrio coralliilyticus]NUW67636.1 methyl-accepting chemotaxis protein [Vibrio coralliilyticus]
MKLSLKQKLIGASLLAVVLMASALTWLSADQLFQQTRNGVNARAESLATAASEGISDWITIREDIAKAFNDYSQEQDVVPYLQQARKAGGFDDIFLGTPEGGMFRSHPERNRADYDPRVRPWYKDANAAGRQIITTAYKDAITNALLVTIAEPVRRNGKLVGVVGADVLIDQLIDDVINLDAGENAYAMLIDTQDGTFLAHPNKDLSLKPVTTLSKKLTMSAIENAANSGAMEIIERKGQEKFYFFKKVPGTQWIFAIEMDRQTEEAAHTALLENLLLTATIITIIVIAVVSWLVSFLFRDLGRVSHALEEIASGEGDLTQRLEPRSDDEVGQLATNFNTFVGNMHAMVSKLSHVSASLSEQAKQTAEHAEERSARIRLQQDEINMVATAINEMAAATQEIAGNADNTAQNSTEAVTACVHGGKQVVQTQSSIQNLAQEVQVATDVIQELETHGNSISTILSTIQDIAEQTNLLALNAAIEAARAGEQGRGFAVVADEVRVLSQRTHASTQEIQQMIETLQSTTGKAVSIMGDSRQLADTSVTDADSAAVSLTQIQSAVEQISDMATQIASAAEEQASVTSEITRNTVGIRDVSNELADEAHDAAAQAAQLSELSHELEQEIGRFKL